MSFLLFGSCENDTVNPTRSKDNLSVACTVGTVPACACPMPENVSYRVVSPNEGKTLQVGSTQILRFWVDPSLGDHEEGMPYFAETAVIKISPEGGISWGMVNGLRLGADNVDYWTIPAEFRSTVPRMMLSPRFFRRDVPPSMSSPTAACRSKRPKPHD